LKISINIISNILNIINSIENVEGELRESSCESNKSIVINSSNKSSYSRIDK